VYGSWSDRETLWEKIGDRGILSLKHMIVAGAFNFSMNEGEIWGM